MQLFSQVRGGAGEIKRASPGVQHWLGDPGQITEPLGNSVSSFESRDSDLHSQGQCEDGTVLSVSGGTLRALPPWEQLSATF